MSLEVLSELELKSSPNWQQPWSTARYNRKRKEEEEHALSPYHNLSGCFLTSEITLASDHPQPCENAGGVAHLSSLQAASMGYDTSQ